MMAGDQELGSSLLGFNLGLELGQVIVVFLILLVAHLVVTIWKVNRREWTIFLSAGTMALALKMALERIP